MKAVKVVRQTYSPGGRSQAVTSILVEDKRLVISRFGRDLHAFITEDPSRYEKVGDVEIPQKLVDDALALINAQIKVNEHLEEFNSL